MESRLIIKLGILCFLGFCKETRAQSISGVINSYYKVTAVNTGASTVTVTSSAGLSPGMRVLLIQMKGATINSTNTATFGNITAINDAGNYEFNYICGISGTDLLMQRQLTRTYNATGNIQLVTIPQYTSVTVSDTLKCNAWNSASGTGGVLVLNASDTVFLNSPIDASDKGFVGGVIMNYPTPTYDCIWTTDVTNYPLSVPPSPSLYYTGGWKGEGIASYISNSEYGRGKQANGGGGGNNHNTGGAGGGNIGLGGNGGRRSNETAFQCHGANPGVGGLSISTYGYTVANNRVFMGGGGGSGHMNNAVGLPGGNGGGIVFVFAKVIVSSGFKILANGGRPINNTNIDPYSADGDGGGGGGAGGTIVLNINSVSGNILTEATGANGSESSRGVSDCTGPGGGGGGGMVWIKAASFPGNISANVNGGTNGVISATSGVVACRGLANGATSGGIGSTNTSWVEPTGSAICSPLPLTDLLLFSGRLENDASVLKWKITTFNSVEKFEVERSENLVQFETIGSIINNNKTDYFYTDKEKIPGILYFRLKLTYKNGQTGFSPIVSIKKDVKPQLYFKNISPNPASTQLRMAIYSDKREQGIIAIINSMGQKTKQIPVFLKPGTNLFYLDIKDLSCGIHWLILESNGTHSGKSFVKQMP